MNLYTSDLHLGHKNVINFDHRPFADVEEMDATLITLWNGRVSNDDDVWVVGDFAYRNEKGIATYLKKLKGRKHLIIGNHDHRLLENKEVLKYFESVDKLLRIKDGDKDIVLCHYPLAEWDGMMRGSWHIYGHIHNNTDVTYRFMKTREHALNAAACINNYTPVSINELIRNNKAFQEKH